MLADNAISEQEIRAALAAILVSAEFKSSRRSQDFLSFVVEQSLAGRAAQLKERTIGIEAFGRAPSYDTNEDGVVRIKASEVRRRLHAYYAAEGSAAPVRIDLPVGSYAPQFVRSHIQQPLPPLLPVPRKPFPWMGAVVAAILIAALILALRTHRHSALDRFWQPVLDAHGSVLVAAAYVPVYDQPDAAATRLTDQYVGGGDLVAATRLTSLFTRIQKPFVVKVGAIAFEDLRNSPTVLIGYSSNQWSAVSSRLRYYIDDDAGRITDWGKPTEWAPHRTDALQHAADDYAIVSRVFDKQTGALLVEATGILQYGTEGAAELITDDNLLSEALRTAPRGWESKNLQLVLHMNVISNYPTSPRVVASYYW